MSGISNLDTLLQNMSPKRREGEYVFLTFEGKAPAALQEKAMLSFHEEEGQTLIVSKALADEHKQNYEAVWGLITLNVHSDLEAVGFLAAISQKLAAAGISMNCISAYYHDHLFVPVEKTGEAMDILLYSAH